MRRLAAYAKLVVAELRVRPGRLMTLAATIALSAMVLTAAFVLGASLREAANSGVRVWLSDADVVVTSESVNGVNEVVGRQSSGSGASAKDLRKLAKIDGVETVAYNTRAIAAAQAGDESRSVTVESLSSDQDFAWQRFKAGRPPQAGNEIALTQSTLDQLRIRLGDPVALGRPEVGRAVLQVVGIVDTRGATVYDDAGYAVATATVAQRLAGLDADMANVVLMKLAPGADARDVVNEINEAAPVGFAQTASDLISSGTSVEQAKVGAVSAVVTAFALLALVVAAVAVSTTTVVGLAARQRTLALQRCVGASRSQLFVQIVGEVLVVGLLGVAVGALAGVALGRVALPLAGFIPGLPDVAAASFTVRPVDIGTVSGLVLGLTLIAGLLPAWRASRVRPVAALQSASREATGSTPRSQGPRRVIRPLLLVLALCAGVLWLQEASSAASLAGAIVLLALAGFAALSTVLLVGARLVLGLLRTGRATSTRLALVDVASAPRRAAAEGIAIAMAVAVIALTWVCLGAVSSSLGQRLDSTASPDLVVGSASGGTALSEDVVARLGSVDGVAESVPVRFGRDVTLRGRDGKRRVSIATGTAALTAAEFNRVLPERFAVRQLREDTVYLPSSATPPFNERSRIRMVGPDGVARKLHVSYVKELATTVVSPKLMTRVSKESDVRVVWLRLADGAHRSTVVDEVGGIGVLAGPVPVGGPTVADLRVERAVGAARATAATLLAVAALVAVIGAAATAAATISTSSREHAILRALGLDRKALARMLAVRSLAIGGVSALIGAAIGAASGRAVASMVQRVLELPESSTALWPILVAVAGVLLIVRAASAVPFESAALVQPARALTA